MYFSCSGGETGGPCPSSDSWLFSRVDKKWKRLQECFSPRMFPAMAPLPMGVDKLRYRTVMYGGGQKRPIEDTDEFSIVWVGRVFHIYWYYSSCFTSVDIYSWTD
jgi:hypothetical protein